MEFLQQVNGCAEGSYNTKSGAQLAYEQQLLRSIAPQQQAPQLSQQWLQQQHKQRSAVPSGRSNSGSSTFSSEPADPAVLDPSALLRTSVQLQRPAQPTLSRDPSCQSNELGALLESNIITEQQLQQQLRQQPGYTQHSLAFHQPALVPLMLPAQLSGDLSLDPQQQQLLRQLSNSTQHSQHSQPGGQGGASTSDHTGSPEGDDAQHARVGAGGGFTTSPANSSQTPAADEEHGAESGKYSLPVANLKVACGDMIGTLMVHKARIRIYEGTERKKEVSPTEFERLGGRSATKKWKQSIRLVGEDGGNGRPVGEWYVQMGLEAPKKPRDKDIQNATSPAVNVFLDRHERHHNKAAVTPAAAAIAAAPTPRSRALRAARHSQAAALASKGRRGRGGVDDMGGLAPWDDAAAVAGSDSTRNTSSIYPPDAMGAWGAMYQQQHGLSTAASLAATSSLQFQPGANPLALSTGDAMAVAEDPAAVAMDAAALDWSQQQQMEATAAIPAAAAATAYAAAVSGEYAVVPVSSGPAGLPGDTSLAVIEMGAYLQGLRSTPPWRLLPINQRPLIGRQLVPLRQLFIMMLHLGGYHSLENDERLWQEIAIQLELPAWPTPEVPDPIRTLQQVYRDYLLRFETRFGLQQLPPGAANGSGSGTAALGGVLLQQAGLAGAAAAGNGSGGGSGGIQQGPVGRQDHSPALSTATTQYNAAAGAAAGARSIAAGLASALGANYPGGSDAAMAAAAALAANRVQQRIPQQLQMPGQPLQTAISGIGDMFLDRSLSGDILDALTDLIPMPHEPGAAAAAAAVARDTGNGSGSSGSGSGNGSSGPDRPGSLTLVQAMAAQELAARHAHTGAPTALGAAAAAGAPGGAGVSRQHPQVSEMQRRKQQQQLLQQLQAMASEVTAGAFAGGSAAGGASRLKRPAPLIRCGDSDLVNLMDQVDVERILTEHEEQRQQQQQHTLAGQQGAAGVQQLQQLQQQQQPSGVNNAATLAAAGGSNAAGTLSEALDADMQDMLEGYLHQHDTAQQQQQQAQPPQQQQQQPGASGLAVKQSEDAVSGMLEALQIERAAAGGAAAGLPQHALQHQLTGEFLPQQYKLHMQQSVGAHLMSDLLNLQQSAGGVAGASPGNSSGPCPAPLRPASAAATAAQQQAQQQQQHQADDAALQAFAGGLLRLTTPNSALLGSVLDSPTHKAAAGQWMDLPPTSLEGAQQAEAQQPVQQQQQQQGRLHEGQAGGSGDIAGLMGIW